MARRMNYVVQTYSRRPSEDDPTRLVSWQESVRRVSRAEYERVAAMHPTVKPDTAYANYTYLRLQEAV